LVYDQGRQAVHSSRIEQPHSTANHQLTSCTTRCQTSASSVLTILKGLVQGISNTIGVQLLSGTFGPVNLALTDPNLFVAPVYLSVQVRRCNHYHSRHNNATPTHALRYSSYRAPSGRRSSQ